MMSALKFILSYPTSSHRTSLHPREKSSLKKNLDSHEDLRNQVLVLSDAKSVGQGQYKSGSLEVCGHVFHPLISLPCRLAKNPQLPLFYSELSSISPPFCNSLE